MSLAQRITTLQQEIVATSDGLQKHLDNLDDSNVTDADLQVSRDFNARINQKKNLLATLEESERNLAGTVAAATTGTAIVVHDPNAAKERIETSGTRFFAAPGKKLMPLDHLIRSGVAMIRAKATGRTADQEIARIPQYANDESTRAVLDWAMRGATGPALTSQAGWVAELVTQIQGAYMDLLYPLSVLPRIAARGTSLTFDRAGRIAIPTRLATPTIAGSFVGEGMPIPVRQGQFAAQVLTPKKLGVITTWSREAGDHSIPALEGLLRDAMQEDTAIAIDSVLLDANPATAIRPPGIFNGVTPITATAGGGINAMIGDFKNLVSAITAATHGRLRAPAWLMNPGQLVSGKLAMAASTGIFPFKEEMDEGNLLGFPIIDSSTVPLATVALIDCADFVMVGAEAPRLEISDVATIHEEDTNPLPISSPGAPATVAAPVRSLWQTDSLGLRLIQPLNWTVRRPGVVSVVQGVTW